MDINLIITETNQFIEFAQYALVTISTWQALAIMGSATAFAAALYAFQAMRLRSRRRALELTCKLDRLERRVKLQAGELERSHRQQKAMQNYLNLLDRRQKQILESRFGRKSQLEEAISCAGNGLGGDDIIRQVGVTGGEARLISALYGRSAATA